MKGVAAFSLEGGVLEIDLRDERQVEGCAS